MQRYYVDFNNMTDNTWTMAVYQTIPNANGPDGGECERTQVPPFSTDGLAWEKDFIAPPNSVQNAPGQAMENALEHEWNIVYRDGVQQLRSGPPSPPDMENKVPNNTSEDSEETTTCWVCLFRNVQADKSLGGDMDIGPIELRFPRGSNAAVIALSGEGESITHGTTYTSR
jgi:hypothetical protein